MTNIQTIQNAIIEIRNQKVLLDSQVAEFYSVETREINQAVQRNLDKFPTGYILNLFTRRMGWIEITKCDFKEYFSKRRQGKTPQSLHRKRPLHARHHSQKPKSD